MRARKLRTIALLASYNEERFIEACLQNLTRQGVEAYLLDNASTDRTVRIAERYVGRGLIDIETIPRDGIYSWKPILERKEELATRLEADWFINMDPDEVRLAPYRGVTLTDAFARVEQDGFNAVNFQEFTFVPTREHPDHDHPSFGTTMTSYYPFFSHERQIKAWKKPARDVSFAFSAAHQISFADLKLYPVDFHMKHYLFLSIDHAIRKYVEKVYDPEELKMGWHQQRAKLTRESIKLPQAREVRRFVDDDELDASNPRLKHFLFDAEWASGQ